MEPIQITFTQRGSRFTAALPQDIPQELRLALQEERFCVPAPPLDCSGLLLCSKAQMQAWQAQIEQLPTALTRTIMLISAYLDRCGPKRLEIPAILLKFAGIEGPALLALREDGALLITPYTPTQT